MVLTDENFNDVINDTDGVLLIKFYADWCHPCKMLDPTLDEVAKDNDVTVAKMDIMTNQNTAAKFGIRSIPTVYIYIDGIKVSQFNGVLPKANIEKLLSEI